MKFLTTMQVIGLSVMLTFIIGVMVLIDATNKLKKKNKNDTLEIDYEMNDSLDCILHFELEKDQRN